MFFNFHYLPLSTRSRYAARLVNVSFVDYPENDVHARTKVLYSAFLVLVLHKAHSNEFPYPADVQWSVVLCHGSRWWPAPRLSINKPHTLPEANHTI